MQTDQPHIKSRQPNNNIEWPTLLLFIAAYVAWAGLTMLHAQLPILIVLVALCFLVALHSSLQHEVIHGHPTKWTRINNALAFPALGLAVAYERYEILHLQHHRNWLITDPYDDSESYFMGRKNWARCNAIVKAILRSNNTLVGRLLVGPTIMVVRMAIGEWQLGKRNQDIVVSWLWHFAGVAMVLLWLWL